MTKNILLILMVLMSGALYSKEVLIDRIIAVVNDDIITESDLKSFNNTLKSRKTKMSPEAYSYASSSNKNMLNEMVNDTLIMQYAKDNGFLSSNEEINEFINSRMRNMGMTQKDLQKQLKDSSQTFDEFRSELKLEKTKADIFERDLKKKIEISESDFEKFFKDQFKQEVNVVEYHIKYIQFDNEADANNAKNNSKKNNESFDKVFNKNNGTDLGFINLDDLIPELKKAVSNMNVGDVKGPVNINNSFYVIKVVSLKNTKNPEYIKNKDAIERELVQMNFSRLLDDWLNQRKEESYVRTYI